MHHRGHHSGLVDTHDSMTREKPGRVRSSPDNAGTVRVSDLALGVAMSYRFSPDVSVHTSYDSGLLPKSVPLCCRAPRSEGPQASMVSKHGIRSAAAQLHKGVLHQEK